MIILFGNNENITGYITELNNGKIKGAKQW
jgi:hypothetical protein